MSFFIALVIIYINAMALSLWAKKRFELTLPIITASLSLILYLFGLFNLRDIGVTLVSLATIAAFVYLLMNVMKKKAEFLQIIKSPGFICLTIATVIICIISRGFLFTSWDELTHWGLVQKNIFLTNNFGNLNDTTTYFRAYPPAISLFSSLFNSFSNIFNESFALRSILILSIAQLAIVFTTIKKKDITKFIIIFAIISILPVIFFDNFYSTIYVDAVLGLIFGNILYFNFSYKKHDLFYAIYMAVQFYLLTNTKQIGICLAGIAFLVISTDAVMRQKEKYVKDLRSILNKEIIYTVVPFISGVFAFLSWKLYLGIHHVNGGPFQVSAIKISDIFGLFGGNLPEYRHTVIVKFINSFFTLRAYGAIRLSYFTLTIAILLLMYLAHKLQDYKKDNSFKHNLVSILGFIPYAGVIMFMYLFSFSEYEATLLASQERYFGSYLLGLLVFAIFCLISSIISNKSINKNRLPNLLLGLIFVALFSMATTDTLIKDTVFSKQSNQSRQSVRNSYTEINQYLPLIGTGDKKLYFISQNSSGYDYWVTRYMIDPIKTSDSNWSLGLPYSSDDIWTVAKTSQQWQKELLGYDYVYLFSIDSKFTSLYSGVFSDPAQIKSRQLYKVVVENNGEASLVLANLTKS